MEKRFWLGVGLMAVLLILGLTVCWGIGRICQPVARQLDQAQSAAEQTDWENARSFLNQARKNWDRRRSLTAAVSDHAPMEQVDSLFDKLEVYAEQGQNALFCAGCGELSTLVEAVSEAHALKWWGFF